MKIQTLAVEEALASLHSSINGLTAEEGRRRLLEYGRNEVERVQGEPMALRFLKGFTHFFAIILWIAAGLAFFAHWRDPDRREPALEIVCPFDDSRMRFCLFPPVSPAYFGS